MLNKQETHAVIAEITRVVRLEVATVDTKRSKSGRTNIQTWQGKLIGSERLKKN